MWKWVKVPKALALIAFILPWMTVSCSGTRLVSASGFGLAFGRFSSEVPLNEHASGGGPGVNLWLVLALIATVAGLVIALRPFRRSSALGVMGASAAAFLLIWFGTARYSKSAILAEADRRRAATDGLGDIGSRMDGVASAIIQVDWHFGFYLALIALIAAGVMAWITYSGREAAVERSLRGAVASARGSAGGLAPVVCPSCGRSYPAGTRFCPEDGTALPPAS